MNSVLKKASPPPFYYHLLIRLAMPFYRMKVKRKSAKLPTLGRELDERFGKQYPTVPQSEKGIIWCHAVSLGELNTAYPLLKLFLANGYGLWITSTTQTGFDRAKILFADEIGKTVQHSFVPVDSIPIVKAFYHHVRPKLALFIETELWATMLYGLVKENIPSALINARLSEKSFLGYQKFEQVSLSMMKNINLIIAQDTQSAKYFRQLRADSHKIRIANSLKWCSDTPTTTSSTTLNRPIWIAGSTHDGEEKLVLEIHKRLLSSHPNTLLIIVPRHPERFEQVAKLCDEYGLTTHRQSKDENISDTTQIYLADSMGELTKWYGVADVALVGGSFVDMGGHNPIEPASLGKPIIMGPSIKNCKNLVESLKEVNALVQTTDISDTLNTVKQWFDNPQSAKNAGKNGQTLTHDKQGADKQQFDIVMELLK
ncbi:3-deoxy-D-manno-octulosonic acid transferase [Moraxella oblonga]|uniref:3-deoxy-D-manno-octulosonic acid transferase n=1 Tax=Moraxella oblonga TaxID=200413 RepID=UPI00082CA1C0|nr:3-deoxy-D-manno-octulosonic acid transferase [Moraxella oblonga]